MNGEGERRVDPSMRAIMEGVARETAKATLAEMETVIQKIAGEASTKALHALLLRLDLDMGNADAVRTRTEDLRWAHRMRKLSERGWLIFFSVAATLISAWFLSSLWQGFGSAVKAVKSATPSVLPAVALVLLTAAPASSQAIPGVRPGCCGVQDCKPAAVSLLGWESGKATVRVNGVTLRVDREAYSTSPFGVSYYCSLPIGPCKGAISDVCVRCVVEAAGQVQNPVNPLAIVQPIAGNIVFIAERDCGRCHR